MEQLDALFFKIFQYYKERYKSKANDLALVYILILQASILLLLGSFFLLFFREMNVDILSTTKAWILYAILLIGLIFRNWIYYTGKKRRILNSKLSKIGTKNQINIWKLWLIPIVVFIFSCFLISRF